ncbi:hypothetical protein D3C75_606330 [compost metagenome]
MRCYHFCNFYLSGIHAGIQAAHAQHELAVKYLGDGFNPDVEIHSEWSHDANIAKYLDWAKNHKTMILLNAGMQGDLLKIEGSLESDKNRFPYASFREDQYALNGALTDVCIVLPEEMYAFNYHINSFEKEPWPGHMEFVENGVKYKLTRNEDRTVNLHHAGQAIYKYNAFDLGLIRTMSSMRLM